MNWKRSLALTLTLCAGLALPASIAAQDTPEASMTRAKQLYRSGDYRGALQHLSEVVAAEPENAEALYLSGYSHLMLREYDQAVDDFARAFEADPMFDPRTIYQRPAAEATG